MTEYDEITQSAISLLQDANFTWIPFYEELADKLLDFKNDRPFLIEILHDVHEQAGVKFPKLEADGYELNDIDPFTVFGCFNKGLSYNNRKKLTWAFKEALDITAEAPDDFSGIPVLNNLNATFYGFKPDRGEHDIDDYWSLFIFALMYADNPSENSRQNFIGAYNQVSTRKFTTWKLTMGLYWIRPKSFINLDQRNRWFIEKCSDLPTNAAQSVRRNMPLPDGADYLRICEGIREEIESGAYGYVNFPELSLVAYYALEEVNKREKTNEEAAANSPDENASDPDAIIGHNESAGDGHEVEPRVPQPPAWPPYTRADFLDEVYMEPERYDELELLVRRKKNVILEGAPGTGKTFAAKRLAWALMGEQAEDRVETIQFHQSYSYEDFVEGFRPVEGGGFELRHGSFYEFCKQAGERPDSDYVLIIDEINRGNLSKIFGELFMLIEADKRGEKVRLLYSGEPFSVPGNLYLIGTMNTADRSLAMLDYALRRRFAFFDLRPGFETEQFKEYTAELQSPAFDELVACIERLNDDIEKDDALGPGFVIGHSFLCGRTAESATPDELRLVVDYELVPLLREYWYDDPDKVEQWADELRGACK